MGTEQGGSLGQFGDSRLDKGGRRCCGCFVARTVCLRQLAQGRAAQMRFWRFVSNPRVSVERLIEGWSDETRRRRRPARAGHPGHQRDQVRHHGG